MKKVKQSNDILIIQKYKGSLVGIVSMTITTIISALCYVITLILLQNEQIACDYGATLNVVKDILLAVVSIVSTSLLTSIFIEKNRKNIDYTELMANDILASPEFYSNLTDENKEKIHKNLEENMYLKAPIKSEIYRLCREQIEANAFNYYYSELHLSISYFDFEYYSEKRINRVMKIRSYSDTIKEKKLFLFSYQLSPTKEINNFEVLTASIGTNNTPLIIGKDIIIEQKDTTNLFWTKCGYKQTYDVYLSKDVSISSDKDTIISIEYVSRVSDGDMSAGFGVSVPCKNFNFNFIAPSNYTVYAHPYGFLNPTINFPNSAYPHNISVCYNNWLLPGEGVAISLTKNGDEPSSKQDVDILVVK